MTLPSPSRRVVASPFWSWDPGMRTTGGWRIISSLDGGAVLRASMEGSGEVAIFSNGAPVRHALASEAVNTWLPDLDDPATFGCLVAKTRKAWQIKGALASRRDGCVGDPAWAVSWLGSLHGGDLGYGQTEVEAWVDALCAARP